MVNTFNIAMNKSIKTRLNWRCYDISDVYLSETLKKLNHIEC